MQIYTPTISESSSLKHLDKSYCNTYHVAGVVLGANNSNHVDHPGGLKDAINAAFAIIIAICRRN